MPTVTLGADKSLDMSFDYLDGGPEVNLLRKVYGCDAIGIGLITVAKKKVELFVSLFSRLLSIHRIQINS